MLISASDHLKINIFNDKRFNGLLLKIIFYIDVLDK